MARNTVVALVLLLGLVLGLAFEPDSGTAASVGPPDITGLAVGANHAKPLPQIPSVVDLLRATTFALLVIVALTQLARVTFEHTTVDDDRQWSVLRSRIHARRGPPASAFC